MYITDLKFYGVFDMIDQHRDLIHINHLLFPQSVFHYNTLTNVNSLLVKTFTLRCWVKICILRQKWGRLVPKDYVSLQYGQRCKFLISLALYFKMLSRNWKKRVFYTVVISDTQFQAWQINSYSYSYYVVMLCFK